MKNLFIISAIFSLISCSNSELEKLKSENEKLIQEVDSLKKINTLENHIPFIDYRDFTGVLGETKDIHFLAVRKGGYEIDSIKIKGYKPYQISEITTVMKDHYSSYIDFTPDSSGIYDFNVFTRRAGDNHTVKQSFIVEIKTAPNNK